MAIGDGIAEAGVGGVAIALLDGQAVVGIVTDAVPEFCDGEVCFSAQGAGHFPPTEAPDAVNALIEEFLTGEEVSILAVTDGEALLILDPVMDHKQIGEGDMVVTCPDGTVRPWRSGEELK